jgi:Cell division protein CrgA
MAKPVKRKVEGGRVTKKPGSSGSSGAGSSGKPGTESSGRTTSSTSGRYTAPVPKEFKVSPRWVPVLMFVLLGLGILIILLNYVGIVPAIGPLPDETSNWYLLIGLAMILGGIITATQWH